VSGSQILITPELISAADSCTTRKGARRLVRAKRRGLEILSALRGGYL